MEDAGPPGPYPSRRRGARPQAAAAAPSVPPHISAAAPPLPHGKSTMDVRLGHQFTAAAAAPLQVSAAAPLPPHGASTMAVNQYRDFFGQSSGFSSSYAASGPAYLAADEFGLSSQAPASPFASSSHSAPYMRMGNLDLNSQADTFPHLDIFPNQEQLHADGARDAHGLPPLRPGGNGSLSHFNPPRASGARSRSGAGSGERPSQPARRSLPLGGIDGGGLRGRVPIRAGRGSTSSGSAVDVNHADSDQGDDNDDDPRFQSPNKSIMGEPTSTACLSTEEALDAATASKEEFINFVKLAAGALFRDLPAGSAGKTTDVLNALTSYEWVRRRDLSQELKMKANQLNLILKFLQEEKLIQIETPAKVKRKKGSMADAQELIIQPNSYCSLDYDKVYKFVKHQINVMKENLMSDLTRQNLVQEYICIQCERRYSAFDAKYLVSTMDDNFHCETCDKNLQPVDGEGRCTTSLGKLEKMKEDLKPLVLSIERLKGIAAPTILSLQQWRDNAQNSLVQSIIARPIVPPTIASKGVSLKSSQLTMKLKELPLWMIREGGVDLTDNQRNEVNDYVRDVEVQNYKTG